MTKKSGNVPDWSGMIPVLLAEIAGRLQTVEDFTAFRGVCPSWRSAAVKEEFGAKSKCVPVLLLPGKSNDWEVYSISNRKVIRTISLPEEVVTVSYNFRGREAPLVFSANVSVCREARFGWVVTATGTCSLSLLNLVSRAIIPLPRVTSIYRNRHDFQKDIGDYIRHHFGTDVDKHKRARRYLHSATLSANPSDDPLRFVLMLLVGSYLLVWRPGDGEWTRPLPEIQFFRLGYCRDKYYGFDWSGKVWVIDADSLGVGLVAVLPGHLFNRKWFYYLVGSSDGELLLIGSRGYFEYDYGSGEEGPHVEVIRIDVNKGECEVMSSGLGGDAVFIGSGSPFCVPASGSGVIKPNCIYFCDNDYVRPMGVYNVGDQSFERFSVGDTLSLVEKPLCQPLLLDSSNIFSY